MTRLLILATIILSIVSYVSAQIIESVNTPLGQISKGANVPVSWSLIPGVDATGKTGQFSVQDNTSKNTIVINEAVPLAAKSYMWNVQVDPGSYTLGLNDGAGLKQSGLVQIVNPAGGAPPAPPAGGPAPGPAPPAGGPAPPAPPAPPAGGPAPPAKAPAPAPAPSGGSSDAAPSTPTPPSAGATPPASASTGSASSIFSGYEVVFSLLGVAVAMVQF